MWFGPQWVNMESHLVSHLSTIHNLQKHLTDGWYCHYLLAYDANHLDTLKLGQDGRYFGRRHIRCIFLNENIWITINISLKFVPKGQVNNIPALVQIMAWCRPSDKPLSEPLWVSLLTHVYPSLGLNELTSEKTFLSLFLLSDDSNKDNLKKKTIPDSKVHGAIMGSTWALCRDVFVVGGGGGGGGGGGIQKH